MTAKEHLDNFLEQPDVQEIEEKYERIITGTYDKWQDIFYVLITEISKDRKIFDTQQQLVAEYGLIRDQAELEIDTYQRNLLVTALFEAFDEGLFAALVDKLIVHKDKVKAVWSDGSKIDMER